MHTVHIVAVDVSCGEGREVDGCCLEAPAGKGMRECERQWVGTNPFLSEIWDRAHSNQDKIKSHDCRIQSNRGVPFLCSPETVLLPM